MRIATIVLNGTFLVLMSIWTLRRWREYRRLRAKGSENAAP